LYFSKLDENSLFRPNDPPSNLDLSGVCEREVTICLINEAIERKYKFKQIQLIVKENKAKKKK
jgi:hypothetical protein